MMWGHQWHVSYGSSGLDSTFLYSLIRNPVLIVVVCTPRCLVVIWEWLFGVIGRVWTGWELEFQKNLYMFVVEFAWAVFPSLERALVLPSICVCSLNFWEWGVLRSSHGLVDRAVFCVLRSSGISFARAVSLQVWTFGRGPLSSSHDLFARVVPCVWCSSDVLVARVVCAYINTEKDIFFHFLISLSLMWCETSLLELGCTICL